MSQPKARKMVKKNNKYVMETEKLYENLDGDNLNTEGLYNILQGADKS